MDASHVDRLAVEKLFGVGERRAWVLKDVGCGGPYREAIPLRPGEMQVVSEQPLALAARMLALTLVMRNDWVAVDRRVEVLRHHHNHKVCAEARLRFMKADEPKPLRRRWARLAAYSSHAIVTDSQARVPRAEPSHHLR